MVSKEEIRVTGWSVGAIIIAHSMLIGPLNELLNKNWMLTLVIGMGIVFTTSRIAQRLGT